MNRSPSFFHSSAGAGSGGGFGSFEDAEAANAREAVRAAAELKKRQEDEDAALARALQEAETEYDNVVDHMCFPAVSNLFFACGAVGVDPTAHTCGRCMAAPRLVADPRGLYAR